MVLGPATAGSPLSSRPQRAEPSETPWLVWGRSAFALIVVVFLAGLGITNIVSHGQGRPVEDGVFWGTRAEGVVAVEVALGSPAARAGIETGDVLLAVNGLPVETRANVIELQHAAHEGTRLTYILVRLGTRQVIDVALAAAPQASSMYYVLAAVGLFTLLVGASVRLKRPRDQATLHFFWLCVAFFGAFTFSFNGPFDRLDWVFYWGDAVAQALLPPLLLHFTLVFPERPVERRTRPQSIGKALGSAALVPLIYLPALLLGAVRVVAIARGSADGRLVSRIIDALDNQVEPVYLFVCTAAAVGVLVSSFQRMTSVTARRQLRWIAWGTVVGVGPFAVAYALPWALGIDPPFPLPWTAILLGFVPLTFASAIVRYRLRDVEVIVKRGLAYIAFSAAAFVLCLALLKLASFVFPQDSDRQNWVIALLATAVFVLLAQPVKEAVQNALDRLFYRDRYDYRRALVAFARDLNSDLDVVRLGQRLVSRIVETLVVDRMALLLAPGPVGGGNTGGSGDFAAISDYGFTEPMPQLPRESSFMPRLDAGHTVALDDPIAATRFAAEDVEFWRDAGIYYFVPCVFEGSAIAVLALGRKDNDEPFNSEDLALLTAVAGQVATAIENGRLYRQLHLKAEELGRMREFNENILESLDDGLVVFNLEERIVRWNRALEGFYGIAREDAIGRRLDDVFDQPFVQALAAARREQPYGATLYRVPLTARHADRNEGAPAERVRPSARSGRSEREVEGRGVGTLGVKAERGEGPPAERVRGVGAPGVKDDRADAAPDARLLVNATVVPLQDPTEDVVAGAILLIEDITDRVRLQQQLQISEKMASIGLLAAGVAHEVNTPLTGISSFTQMLLEGADPDDPRTALLEKIERQTFRAAKIVNGLLNLSRPGTEANDPVYVDLNTVITDVYSLLEHQFEVGRVKIRRELAPAPAPVLGIEHQLQQVFLNLFLNARDAMPSGGWLLVSTRLEDDRVVAEIADTGSGIPAEHLARIYDPFFTTKAIGRGTGLGLSISYGIIREHEGTLHCDSAVGQGTRFTLSLPRAADVERASVRR